MSESSLSNNKRIAKNTVLLYVRTFVVMIISLYTSRIILQILGVEDYGIYQVVGGMVAMLAVISHALSSAISRYITYEIGSGDTKRLFKIFSTSKAVQLVIAGIVLVLGEIVGLWFLHTQMQIPEGRMNAANWVLQFSLLSFCVNLLNIPYNACIIAHERMKAFAYVSIFESLCRLGVCYILIISPVDRLVTYAFLLMLVVLVIRFIYIFYCRRYFNECHAPLRIHKSIFTDLFGFAGWGFFTNANYLLNNQGVNMLINVFFGVTFNAARGLANQVESAVMQFVNSFTTAINPQITKSYASGKYDEMFQLVYRGAKFSFFLMYMMALPLIMEAETVLNIWLTVIPEKTIIFVKLSLVLGMFECFGNTSVTACMATGKIRTYSLVIGTLGLLEFPLVWIAFAAGAQIEFAYYLYIVVKAIVIIARMFLMKKMISMPINEYFKMAISPVLIVAFLSAIPSIIVVMMMPESILRLIVSIVAGVLSVGTISVFVGMTRNERSVIIARSKEFINSKLHRR